MFCGEGDFSNVSICVDIFFYFMGNLGSVSNKKIFLSNFLDMLKLALICNPQDN